MANVKKQKRRRTKRKHIDDVYYADNAPKAIIVDSNHRKYKCYFDGACDVNPCGNMGIGSVIYNGSKMEFDYSYGIHASRNNSNNVAEYLGIISIFEWLLENLHKGDSAIIYGDSRMVIMQMIGAWKIKEGLYKEYAIKAKKLLLNLKSNGIIVKFKWIPRERNVEADTLSKDGIDSLEFY